MKQLNNDKQSRHAKEKGGNPQDLNTRKKTHKHLRDAKSDQVARGNSVEEGHAGRDSWN